MSMRSNFQNKKASFQLNTKHRFSSARQLKAKAHESSSQENHFRASSYQLLVLKKLKYEIKLTNVTGNSLSVHNCPVFCVTSHTVPHVRVHLTVERIKNIFKGIDMTVVF